jgi:hypothetical protein
MKARRFRRPSNTRRTAMKAQWRANQAKSLEVARHQLAELVGPPESYPTHAAYMVAIRHAVASKRADAGAALGEVA